MKKIAIILILIFPVIAMAQSDSIKYYQEKYKFDIKDNGIMFNHIIQIPNTSKKDLFNKVLESLSLLYGNPKEAIQLSDKDTGTIIANHECIVFIGFPHVVTSSYTTKISIEDNKCTMKLKVSDYEESGNTIGFILKSQPFSEENRRIPKIYFNGLCNGVSQVFEGIEKAIKKDDW